MEIDRARPWEHLARITQWPSWARHIRSIQLTPGEGLSADTAGTIKLAGGIRSTFRMQRLDPPNGWLWVGGFLWLEVHYDHLFEEIAGQRTRIRFIIEVKGLGANSLGRLFAFIYARNLDRAIPNLIVELEALGNQAPPAHKVS